jgi:septum formation protein
LKQIKVDFIKLNITVPEIRDADETPRIFVKRVAIEKALAGWLSIERKQDLPVLGADTIVVIDDQILGKPAGRDEGIAMLEKLAGRTHQVLSAVALVQGTRVATRLSVSKVTFAPLSADSIAAYWNCDEAHDKAGAYAIQGMAAIFAKRLTGSYSGVMGLPLFETAQLLRDFGVTILA